MNNHNQMNYLGQISPPNRLKREFVKWIEYAIQDRPLRVRETYSATDTRCYCESAQQKFDT